MDLVQLLTGLVGLGVGGALAAIILTVTIPGMQADHKEQVRELIACFRSAIDKIGTRLDRIEEKLDGDLCKRPTLRVYKPDEPLDEK